jgi:hypothetical protein
LLIKSGSGSGSLKPGNLKGANQLNAYEREELFTHLEIMLETLKYGSITLVIQDGKIVQIEKNEKVRLQSNKNR